MCDPRRRLEHLEARMQGVWPADVQAAKLRALARVRLKIAQVTRPVGHPDIEDARVLLAEDTPEQAAADLKVLRCWARQYPMTLYRADGARARITAKLEEMHQRLQAGKGEPWIPEP
jgi:hypothetical protein